MQAKRVSTYGKTVPCPVTPCIAWCRSQDVRGSERTLIAMFERVAELVHFPLTSQRLRQVNLSSGRQQPRTLVSFGIPQRAGWVVRITATYGTLLESNYGNVGGFQRDAKASRPPMSEGVKQSSDQAA